MNLSTLLTPIQKRTLLRKGVIMEQHKEPALSRDIKRIHADKHTKSPELTAYGSMQEVTPDEIIAAAKAARIVDERDGMPLWKKLKAKHGEQVIVLVDAIDDEPYISSQMGPMLYYREQCVSGLRLAQKALGSDACAILIYKNITALETRIPATICGVNVKRIGGAYPAEIRSELDLGTDEGKRHLYIGACSLIHLHRAVFEGRAQTTAFITVNGNCIGSPRNLEIPIGDTASDALDACGLIDDPTRVVVGGSLTGTSIDDTSKAVIASTTRAVLAFRENERETNYSCIGCGRCISCCPSGLNPMLIYALLDSGRADDADMLDPERCVGCMTCSYVCPAKLDIAAAIGRRLAERKVEKA